MSAEVASIGVEELWQEFQRQKREKWQAGVSEHRKDPSHGFQGCPMDEASKETVDFSNYVDCESMAGGRVSEEERLEWERIMFQAFKWTYDVRQR